MKKEFSWPGAVVGGAVVAIFIVGGTFFGFLMGYGGIGGTVLSVLCVLVGGLIGGLLPSTPTGGGGF